MLPELMDQPCSYAELQGCLRDIERVNRLTFAYRPTLSWLNDLVLSQPKRPASLHIVDVGCGSGGMLRSIRAWANKRELAVTLTGIDLNGDAVRAAREASNDAPIQWVHGDAFSYQAVGGVDVVISSLLTHHLEEPAIIQFLAWMEATTRMGWFINDLHRRPVPYHLFRLLTRVLPFHRFVQHDGLVSIRRSFRVDDWQRLCHDAGLRLADIAIEEYRPARLCVGRMKL